MSLSGLILKLAGWKVDITQPDKKKRNHGSSSLLALFCGP